MSKIEERKARAEYETDIPRCGNCSRIVRHKHRTPSGGPVKTCSLLGWHVQENSVCKHWCSPEGDVLE